MPEQELVMLGIGVGSGLFTASIATAVIVHRYLDLHSDVVEQLMHETIGKHAYLRATKEIVDDETDEQIQKRGDEILEEYDLEVFDIGGDGGAE